MLKQKVKFVECDDDQAYFGRSFDPRPLLVFGHTYNLLKEEVHSWHTLFYLEGHETTPFNSVCFEKV